jgi:ubiquinone/menaquinone biosynthesis C-methylase UbiE
MLSAEVLAELFQNHVPPPQGRRAFAAMDQEVVKDYYCKPRVLEHYTRATYGVGLWQSEQISFTRHFGKRHPLLELGTGTGRIAFGLEKLGYDNIDALDLSESMIAQARVIAASCNSAVRFKVADACKLPYADASFDGAIFGFNGMMQIPGRENRRTAMREVFRVLRPGAHFIFTTHDRDNTHYRKFWLEQKALWDLGGRDDRLEDFGDRYEDTPLGMLFIHIPDRQEIREDIDAAGFRFVSDTPRSLLANETELVRDFSDDCRFWIARKAKVEAD